MSNANPVHWAEIIYTAAKARQTCWLQFEVQRFEGWGVSVRINGRPNLKEWALVENALRLYVSICDSDNDKGESDAR